MTKVRQKDEAVFFFGSFLAFIPIFIGRQAKEMNTITLIRTGKGSEPTY